MATDYKTIQPKEYYEHFLKYDVRPDKRDMEAFRSACIDVGSITTANGSALVKLDKTVVLCGIKAELANPLDEEPEKGFIVPNVDLPPLCSGRFRPGPPTPQAQIYSQQVLDILKRSGCISAEDLCIVKVMAALKNAKVPEVSISSEDGSIEVGDDLTSLKIDHLTFSATFTLFKNTVVADPTSEEENLAEGFINIFSNEDGTLCSMTGSCAILEGKMSAYIQLAKQRTAKLAALVLKTVS